MKKNKWNYLLLTCAVCLVPIVFGVILWDKLPQSIAVHFDLNGNPDGFASKAFAVIGLPVMMALLQVICCLINDLNAAAHGERKKFEHATKWILPVMSIVLNGATLLYALGVAIEMHKAACVIVGVVFLVLGNYLPKFDYVKNYDIDTQKARKINRFIGYENVVMGIAFLVGAFLPPAYNALCLILLIPYALIAVIYSIWVVKKG